jgi:copper(I)-binding protein
MSPVSPVRRRRALAAGAALLALTAVSACSSGRSAAELRVSGAYIPQPALADMAAGYFTVTNTGGTDATLTSVTSSFAASITMHSTTDGRMRTADSFDVPAGGKLVLSLGGNHLMLMDLKRKPLAGEKVSLKLHFSDADPITVPVPVKPAGYQPRK